MLVFFALIFIHVLFFLSIFEIYFKSPIIENIPLSEKAQGIQLAKRVVIFYADGVRAEKFYEVSNRNSHSPYLRSLLETHQACGGIAHTRVPTETRPGAIAMLAGFYEDPSAIFKGWQDNPVEFDHIFNQSGFSVAFGSPDVLKMFSRGFKQTQQKRFHFEFYDENEQEFKNETYLNYWVGNKTLKYLTSGEDSASLLQDKVIYMLHFLGPDTAGHNYKPNSREYAENILSVDRIVETVTQAINKFYHHDNQTAFIYSSDHGMTDWGSHGDGSDHETRTPFLAWGAGVGCISYPSPSPEESNTFLPMSDGLLDIAQVDIVSLVSTLLGIPIPVHSVGELPLQFLSLDLPQQARAMHSNSIQIHNAYQTLRTERRKAVANFLFTPFHDLSEHEEMILLNEIELGFKLENYKVVIAQCVRLIRLSLAGLSYFHTYYQTTLLAYITMAYLGLFSLIFTSATKGCRLSQWFVKLNGWFYAWLVFVLLHSYCLGLPIQGYVFTVLPVFLWFLPRIELQERYRRGWDEIETVEFDLESIFFYVGGALMLVSTFFYRWMLSILLVCIAVRYIMKWMQYNAFWDGYRKPYLDLLYGLSLMILAVFPILPIVGTHETNKYLLMMAGISCLTYSKYSSLLNGLYIYINPDCSTTDTSIYSTCSTTLLTIQRILTYVTVVHVFLWTVPHAYRVQFVVSWLILALSPLSILFSPSEPKARLLCIGFALIPPFILLCASYEVFFVLVLLVHLVFWFDMERYQRSSLLHQAFMIIVYLFLSFFGLGNIASVNSYDWSVVRFFISVFSPFTMLTFFLLKIFIPFLLVSCTVRAIHVKCNSGRESIRASTETVLLLVLGLCDIMGLVFLFLVRNTGSWKDIGLSISHVVIVNCITLALMCLYSVASVLVPSDERKDKGRLAT